MPLDSSTEKTATIPGWSRAASALASAEAREPLRIRGHLRRQDLDRDFALELRVASPIHLSHPALPERGADLEDAEPVACR